jgi:putative peptidoglycan lipid II flippase
VKANRGSATGQSHGRKRERRDLARAAGVLGGLTLASRVTGLVRDMVIGALFGTSASADAFFIAFRIPNLFRRVVAEGATSTAVVPVLTSYHEREGPRSAMRAAGALGIISAVVLAGASLIGSLFAAPIVGLFAPGFTADPAKHLLTVRLTAAVFPYLGLVGMAAWAMGVLHTFRRFAAPAYGPVLFNVAMIVAALGLSGRFATPVYALAVGVVAGGALQFLVQLPALRAVGLDTQCFTAGHPAVARVGRLLIPTILGGAVYQINILVGTVLGSLLAARSISYLWYADRLFEFPLGIIAVAVGTAVLPTMSSHASGARYEEMTAGAEHALQLVWALCIPATVGLWILAPSLVSSLFERGEFGMTDASMTADALRAFVVGLLGVASARVLVSIFYALERPRVPVVTGIVALLVNAICDLTTMGPVAPATSAISRVISDLSTRWSIAAMGHVLLFARRLLPGFDGGRLARSAAKHCCAAGIMGVAVKAYLVWISTFHLAYAKYVSLGGGLLIGGMTYVTLCLALRSEEMRDLIGSLRRED